MKITKKKREIRKKIVLKNVKRKKKIWKIRDLENNEENSEKRFHGGFHCSYYFSLSLNSYSNFS